MDVVWIEDPVVEYQKLEGQMLAAEAPKPQNEVAAGAQDVPDSAPADTEDPS